jgi:uncharacterized protein
MFKRVLPILLLLLVLSGAVLAQAKLPVSSGYINDFAELLSPQEKKELTAISAGLKQRTGAELAVAVVKSVAPLDSRLYAVKLFEKWGIGEKSKDNGILLLLAMEEKRVEIEVGYGLEGTLNDALCGRILDTYAVPSFKAGKFGEGLIATARAISETVAGKEVPLAEQQEAAAPDDIGIAFFIAIIAIIILSIVLKRPFSLFGGLFGAFWGAAWGWPGVVLGALIGFFLGFWGPRFSGGGGSFSGGSFGGGGFSGGGGFGGGRSGGGGAGRGW